MQLPPARAPPASTCGSAFATSRRLNYYFMEEEKMAEWTRNPYAFGVVLEEGA